MNEEYKGSYMDENMDKKITKCFINNKSRFRNEIFVIYEDDNREVIFRYNPNKLEFDHSEFIGKTKLEAVFMCDRRKPLSAVTYGPSAYTKF